MMTLDQLARRVIDEDSRARRQKKRTHRMVQAALATWPGVDGMAEGPPSLAWKKATVAEYQRQHEEPKRKGEGIPIALLMLLAEIVVKLLLYWWQNREVTTAELTRLHLQA